MLTPEQMKALAEQTATIVAAQMADKEKAAAAQTDEKIKAAFDAKAKAEADAAKAAPPPFLTQGKTAPAVEPTERRHPRIVVGKHMSEGSGINLARLIKAKFVSQTEQRPVLEVLKSWGDEVVRKALSENSFSGMGSTVHPQFAAEVIELLRPMVIVRRAGARQLPMGATLTFDRQSGAASAQYVGETTTISNSNPTTDAVSLSEKKLAATVGIPNDLLRNSSIQAEEFVRDDLLRVMSQKEDEQFLVGSGSQFSPRGIFNQVASGNKYNETIASAGAPTLQEMKKEFNKAKKRMKTQNVPMLNPVWITSANPEQAILDAVGPGAEGFNILENEYLKYGTVRNFPFFVSNQIPTNFSTDRTYLGLFDMSEVLIGDSLALEIEVFPNGAFTSNGTLISGISTDQSAVRALSKHDIALRHSVSGQVVQNCSWGNS